MKELITFVAGNLEADEAEGLFISDRLPTFAANGDFPEFHESPLLFCWRLHESQFVVAAHAKRTSTGAISRLLNTIVVHFFLLLPLIWIP